MVAVLPDEITQHTIVLGPTSPLEPEAVMMSCYRPAGCPDPLVTALDAWPEGTDL